MICGGFMSSSAYCSNGDNANELGAQLVAQILMATKQNTDLPAATNGQQQDSVGTVTSLTDDYDDSQGAQLNQLFEQQPQNLIPESELDVGVSQMDQGPTQDTNQPMVEEQRAQIVGQEPNQVSEVETISTNEPQMQTSQNAVVTQRRRGTQAQRQPNYASSNGNDGQSRQGRSNQRQVFVQKSQPQQIEMSQHEAIQPQIQQNYVDGSENGAQMISQIPQQPEIITSDVSQSQQPAEIQPPQPAFIRVVDAVPQRTNQTIVQPVATQQYAPQTQMATQQTVAPIQGQIEPVAAPVVLTTSQPEPTQTPVIEDDQIGLISETGKVVPFKNINELNNIKDGWYYYTSDLQDFVQDNVDANGVLTIPEPGSADVEKAPTEPEIKAEANEVVKDNADATIATVEAEPKAEPNETAKTPDEPKKEEAETKEPTQKSSDEPAKEEPVVEPVKESSEPKNEEAKEEAQKDNEEKAEEQKAAEQPKAESSESQTIAPQLPESVSITTDGKLMINRPVLIEIQQ